MEIKAKAGLNKVGKVLAASVALGACAAYAAPDNNWQGGSENTEVSRTSNWSQGYVPTANMRFEAASKGKTVTFDQLVNITDYLWVGSTTAGDYFTPASGDTAEVFNPVVWNATDSTYGIHQTSGSLRFADASNQNAGLVINGGTYTTDAEIWIGKSGGTAKVVLNEGTLACNGDFLMSTDANGASYLVVGSGDATREAKVTVPTSKWAKLTSADYGKGVMTLKAGGEFHCGFLQMNSADSTVIFDGGTFVKDGDVSNTIGSLFGRNQNQYMFWVNEGAKLVVTENGGTLDIGTYTTRIDFPIVLADGASAGTLVTKGTARLTLNGANGFAGTLHVTEGGVLQLPAGTSIGGLEIEDGAFVYITSENEVAAGDTLLTVAQDITSISNKIVSATMKTEVVEESGVWLVKAVEYGEDEPHCTYWLSSGSDNWSDSSKWSAGVPSETTCAVFLKSALLRINADKSAKKIVIGQGCTLTVHKSGNWPNIRAEEIVGPGNIVVSSIGIKPISGKTLKLYANVSTDTTAGGAKQDCWIEGNDAESRLELYGTITVDNQPLRVNQAMDIYGRIVFTRDDDGGEDNYIKSSAVKAGGIVESAANGKAHLTSDNTVEEGAILKASAGGLLIVNSGTTCSAGSIGLAEAEGKLQFNAGMTFAGNLTGSGTVACETGDSSPVTFTGNNELFSGTVEKHSRGPIRFDSETAGSPLASWVIGGDIRIGVSAGTLKFGQIDYHPTNSWSVCYAENATGENFLTLEIGAKGGNSNLGNALAICSGNNNLNIRKVGAGNLDLWFNTYKNIDIHEGVATYWNNNGPSVNYTFTGGTMKLKFLPTWNFLDRINNSTGPVAIDTDGTDFGLYQKGTINNTNTGGFTKLGDGILTIWADLAYTGPTTVSGGKLFIKGGVANLGGGAVTVDEGATLNLYADHIAFTDGEPVVLLNGQIDADSASRVVVSGVNKEITVSAGENVTAVSAAADNSIPNRWVGIERDNWTTPSCWSKGVPQAEQSIAFDYDCHVGNMNFGGVSLNKIIIKVGVEVEFLCQNGKNPSVNVNGIEIDGDGEATIALYHAGIQSRSGRLDTPSNLNLRMTHTTTDSWLRNLNVYGKLLGDGILRPYSVYFYGDNSQFNGTITVLDAGSHICDVAASATNAVWDLEQDIAFDIMEGTFKMGALNCKNQRVWYTKNGSTATIEVGHKNTDFGTTDSLYFWGPETYAAITVPELVFKKVGTGKWSYSGKGIRHIVVEEGELALGQYAGTDTKFDNNSGFQLDTLVVKSDATLSGSLGRQPILSLVMEEGAILAPTVTYTAAVPAVEDDPATEADESVAEVPASWTVSTLTATEASVQDMIVRLNDDSKAALANIPGERPLVLSASTLNGKPNRVAQDTNGDSIAADGSNIWLVRRGASGVTLTAGRQNPGFMIIVQ